MINYSKLRFDEETNLVKVLEDDFAFKNYYGIFENEDELTNVVNSLLSRGIQLNKIIAPRLYQICSDVKKTIDFDEDIDFYIISDVEFNAFSINGFNYVPHIICLTSSLVQSFSDDELAFVIGHEIGHLIFKHSQLGIVRSMLINNASRSLPAQIQNIFARWQKYGEISSDRIGYIAMPNIETIGKVFFKLASGLSEEHLQFNIKEYLNQLDNIKNMSRSEFFASHPSNLVRLKCLELFSQSEFYSECKQTPMSQDELKAAMHEVLNLLEYHPKNDDQKYAVEFIASVGMFISCVDGEINPKENETLYNFLSRYTSQPENYLKFKDIQEVVDRTNAICEYYADAKNDSKFTLCELIAYLTICDGKLDEQEKRALYDLADRLHIEHDRMTQIIRYVLRYLEPQHTGQSAPAGNFFQTVK